jgi:hypothetical protein
MSTAAAAIPGSQVSFKKVFYDDDEAIVVPITRYSGRNKELNDKRNECLLARYYFTGRNTGKYYNQLLHIVSNEFFITSFHVSKIILQNNHKLQQLKKEWKKEPVEKMQKAFTKKWPHLVW